MSIDTHRDIRKLKPHDYVEGAYSILNPQIGTTRNGKDYLKCLLRDATGDAPARQWSFNRDHLSELGETGFVWISGQTQDYNGQLQIILEQVRKHEVSQDEMLYLLPATKKDIDVMFREVEGLLRSLDHHGMRALAELFLTDEDLMRRFRQAPAAMLLHHAWIGGLLEHTLQLMKLADGMLQHYPALNRDLVLMGLFLHDLGKVYELTWERGFEYTIGGNLIGHVVGGAMILKEKLNEMPASGQGSLSEHSEMALIHIVLSHHGVLEFGAAKVPSTPEAIFVANLDDLDAKTQMGITAARDGNDDEESVHRGPLTDKIWALNTRLYKPDPLAGD
ncbi:MAG: HD domain-containing protein [Phycisphaerales bacterium]|nr:HD domain-containing protein [Phycisphaerales bacterium]